MKAAIQKCRGRTVKQRHRANEVQGWLRQGVIENDVASKERTRGEYGKYHWHWSQIMSINIHINVTTSMHVITSTIIHHWRNQYAHLDDGVLIPFVCCHIYVMIPRNWRMINSTEFGCFQLVVLSMVLGVTGNRQYSSGASPLIMPAGHDNVAREFMEIKWINGIFSCSGKCTELLFSELQFGHEKYHNTIMVAILFWIAQYKPFRFSNQINS